LIAVVDYGMGNLRSVEKALELVGVPVRVTSDAGVIEAAAGVVLPGVGAFAEAMENLERLGLSGPVRRAIREGKPFLGICLGFQLLFEEGEEGGVPGLGVLPGRVPRLPAGVKIPHMGWNSLQFRQPALLWDGIPDGSYFYFVHSYYVEPAQDHLVAATTDYGISFAAAVARGNLFGVQFHPEKSSSLGLRMLKNFGRLF